MATPTAPEGLIEKGNIDLFTRPKVRGKDGAVSTVRTISVNFDGQEILIPTVIGDKIVSDDEAIKHFEQTGEHLGKFKTSKEATDYAELLHQQQEKLYTTTEGSELIKIVQGLRK